MGSDFAWNHLNALFGYIEEKERKKNVRKKVDFYIICYERMRKERKEK